MKLDITKGIQKKGFDVPFELTDAWGEDHWNIFTGKAVSSDSLCFDYGSDSGRGFPYFIFEF